MVTRSDLLQTIGRRRSVRVFRPYRDVEREKLLVILEAARRASHWGNLSAAQAIVVPMREVSDELRSFLSSPTGALALRTAPLVLLWVIDFRRLEDLRARQEELIEHGAFGVDPVRAKRRIEKLLIPLVHRRRKQVLASGLFEMDAGQAIAQATLAAFELELGSCLCALPEADRLRQLLCLPDEVRLLVAQAIGYPLESTVPARPRKAFSEIFHHLEFGKGIGVDSNEEQYLNDLFSTPGLPPAWREEELKWLAEILGDDGKLL